MVYEDLFQPKKEGQFHGLEKYFAFHNVKLSSGATHIVEEVVRFCLLLKKKKTKTIEKLHPGLNYFGKIGSTGSECPQGPQFIS